LGSACTYGAIFRPLEMAKAGAPSLTTSRLMMAIAPIMVIYGAAYILFPKFVEQHLGGYPGQRSSQHLRAKKLSASYSIRLDIYAGQFDTRNWLSDLGKLPVERAWL
jgi:hypothetical protein